MTVWVPFRIRSVGVLQAVLDRLHFNDLRRLDRTFLLPFGGGQQPRQSGFRSAIAIDPIELHAVVASTGGDIDDRRAECISSQEPGQCKIGFGLPIVRIIDRCRF